MEIIYTGYPISFFPHTLNVIKKRINELPANDQRCDVELHVISFSATLDGPYAYAMNE